MKRTRFFPAIAILLFLLSALAPLFVVKAGTVADFDVVDGEFLAMVRDQAEASALAERYGMAVVEVSESGLAVFRGDPGRAVQYIAAGFAYNAKSAIATDVLGRESDPYLSDQYALDLTRVTEAWELETGSSAITVAIIDTGIDVTHDEFAGRISPLSYNTVTDTAGSAAVVDDVGHGTMVAGVIGAIRANRIGIAGIAQNVALLVIKANAAGEGSFSDASIIEGIYYAVNHGADVINLSLGGSYANPLTKTAVEYAFEHDVVVVGAAGNDGTDELFYPASFPTVLSVGAVGPTSMVADYSNHNAAVDFAAPGTDIVTTSLSDGYASVSGTSFAAPQVTGVVALLRSYLPDATVPEIRARLEGTADDAGPIGVDPYYGYGIVDAYALLATVFHEVSFFTDGGSSVDSVWIQDGRYLTLPLPPTKPDMVFVGWCLDEALTVPWVRGVPVTADMTLYAFFSDSHHTVTFFTDGAPIDALVVAHGDVFDLPASVRDGYRFTGWFVDEERTVPYESAPVTSDLSLYAGFSAIVVHDVTLVVLDETDAVLTFEEGSAVVLPDAVREGYAFRGWFLDAEATIPYVPAPATADLVLYAGMDRIVLYATVVTPGDPIDPVAFFYGEVPALPDPTMADHEFAGWYLDETYSTSYVPAPATAAITLYARFLATSFSITLRVPESLDTVYYYSPGEVPAPADPVATGATFSGWFVDEALLQAYVPAPIAGDLVLYAKLEPIVYLVRFHDAAGTVIATDHVLYGAAATPPADPVRTATLAVTFSFAGWSEAFDSVVADLDLYPRYTMAFDATTVALVPSVDTIASNDVWIDPGVECADPTVEVVASGIPAAILAGRFVVTYAIVFEDVEVYRLSRIVNVRTTTVPVEITLRDGLSTIPVGGAYVEAGATSNRGSVAITGTVDTGVPGIYLITYAVELDGATTTRTRYVFVVDAGGTVPVLSIPLWRKEEDHA
ncbi:MAG: S8 family serine peptidase [Candidatus Izemoplasmatales bacterium]